AINAGGADGLLYGNAELVLEQIIGVVFTIVFSFGVSWVIFKLLDMTIGLRPDSDAEEVGLDQSEHAETGYVL
ncbi:MAG: ammonia channel protein, partial [Actinomycetota bacterium]|nr:ammonia channel protein [Actinomycetota bacterium]